MKNTAAASTSLVVRNKANLRLANDLQRQLELFKELGVSQGLIFKCCIMMRPDGGYALVTRKEDDGAGYSSTDSSPVASNVRNFTYAGRYSRYGREEDRLVEGCALELGEVQAFTRPF